MRTPLFHDIEPCRMADTLYYIGVSSGPCYLLETADGPVLIDTAFPQSYALLLEHMQKIGKNPRDIRHIIHTHGHYDHVGATRALVALSGAKTYIGCGDEEAVEGKNDLIYAAEFGQVYREAFVPDVLLHDGDVLSFGDLEIRFVATPGHTAGTMSLFFSLPVDGRPVFAGMFGGAGQNTLTTEYLTRHHLPPTMREAYLQSIDRLMTEPVEFHIGNHLGDNHFSEKVMRLHEKENPFVADHTWRPFLERKKRRALERFADTNW